MKAPFLKREKENVMIQMGVLSLYLQNKGLRSDFMRQTGNKGIFFQENS
jgi:hypothetical protein